MKRIRVLVVEDSLTIRKYLVDVLSAGQEFEIIGEGRDGKQAIEFCQSLRPDVVTMDIVLPMMSGVAATEYIMAYCPTPILVVSASANRGEAFKTYDALAAGALDVMEKPSGTSTQEAWETHFRATVRMVSRIKVITHHRGRLKESLWRAETSLAATEPATGRLRAIGIGASTGGPAAMADILQVIPLDYPIPLFLVIHIADQFAFALAEWLNTQSKIPVRFAADLQRLPAVGQPGITLAPAGSHLTIQAGVLHLVKTPERHSCRPSVDVLFESMASEFGEDAACILLTGMGRDGAAGLLAARRAGALTIAQDEASSVVFGMPAEAIKLNAARRILPLEKIGPALLDLAHSSERPNGKLL